MYTYVNKDAKGQHWVSFSVTLYCIDFVTWSQADYEFTNFARLGVCQATGFLPSPLHGHQYDSPGTQSHDFLHVLWRLNSDSYACFRNNLAEELLLSGSDHAAAARNSI